MISAILSVLCQSPRAFCVILLVCQLSGLAAAQGSAVPPPQRQAQPSTLPPASSQAYTLPPGKLQQAITLNQIRLALEIVATLWSFAVLWLLLATRAAAALEARIERAVKYRWLQGMLFFAAFFAITTLADLPLDAIGHAVSRHYGIGVQGWPGWFGDQGKALALAATLGSLVLLLFNWLVRQSPRHYWVWIWALSIPLILISVFATPLVIDPIFNKFEPLEKTHSRLVSRLEQVVARTGTHIPPDRMFLMKASQKSNGLNAYVTGIGSTKRFVLWDTATDRLPDDEVLFIFGHESGHYVLDHIPKMLAMLTVGLFFILWASAACAERMVRRFGLQWQIPSVATRAGFLTLVFALAIAGFLLTPVTNTLSRHFEHQADVYGQEAIHGIVPNPQKSAVSAFNHLGEAWLEDPDPNRFLEFWDYNHPSVKNRANFASHYNPWADKGGGEFFSK